MQYLKIGDDLYQATFTGKMADKDWDNRPTKTITLNMSYDMATIILHDNVNWHIYDKIIVEQEKLDENGEPWVDIDGQIAKEKIDMSRDYDNSDYCLMGDVTVHPEGTVSVKMGKLTDLEQAYELLYGGI